MLLSLLFFISGKFDGIHDSHCNVIAYPSCVREDVQGNFGQKPTRLFAATSSLKFSLDCHGNFKPSWGNGRSRAH